MPGHPILGAVLGSALGASALGSVPVVDVLTSWQGSFGFVAGYIAGRIIQEGTKSNYEALPYIAAGAVPLLAGGVVDRAFLGLAAGGVIGAYFMDHSKIEPPPKGDDK